MDGWMRHEQLPESVHARMRGNTDEMSELMTE